MARRIDLFRLLDGLISVYKPPNFSLDKFCRLFKKQVAEEFNALPAEPKQIRSILRQPVKSQSTIPMIISIPDIVDDELVLGRRFSPGDFVIHPIDPLDDMGSGVQIFGIGENGVYTHATEFSGSFWLKTYHVTGMLGRASTTGTAVGSTLLRSSWRHVTRVKLDRVLTGLLAQFRRSALLHAGIRPNTQEAYISLAKRASGSDLRPVTPVAVETDWEDREHLVSKWERHPPPYGASPLNSAGEFPVADEADRRLKAPYVNSLKCVNFDPPFFTLEIQVAHETQQFFIDFVSNLGPRLRAATLLSGLRRVRHGRLTIEDALLLKQCTVPCELLQALSDEVCRDEPRRLDDVSDTMHLLRVLSESHKNANAPHLFTNLFLCSSLHPLSSSDIPDLQSARKAHFLTPVDSSGAHF
ncbi:putative tRNA pseudouridine synthase 2 [Paragonimus heterotremus]|uniref:Putative tRNA pseudouridine synthase 2 n=1 Tax=Paragonimus heterotremus TaxID=100268 RepID=A0A8J4TJ32_9TREM|nr:putative tRNA pseudouridine synthase 2 [Paragonimus heterotremus]